MLRKLFSQLFVFFVLSIVVSCNTKKKSGISDVLESTLPSVVTVKLSEAQKFKNSFGFADTGMAKMSTADIAYADVLKLGNAKGTGSGFIIEEEGKKYIVTNAHVIESAENLNNNITVFTYDRKEYEVSLVGADSYYDIAVLRFVNEPDSLKPIQYGSDNYRIGQTVFAIGNPLSSFPYTVTQGIISAKNRQGMISKSGYMQTTAMLSPGNSGGPLIDEDGTLIGVNTLGVSEAQQLNFSLETKVLRRIVADLIAKGKVTRAYLGIEAAEFVKYTYDEKNRLKTEPLFNRPVLWHVIPGSPANSLLDYVGYTLMEINGQEIMSNEDILNALEEVKPNSVVKILLEKDGIKIDRQIDAGELTGNRLSDIAQFYFKEHYNIDLDKNNDGVIMISPSGVQNNQLQYYDRSNEKFVSFTPQGARAYIIGCGNTNDLENIDFWKVDNFEDLGRAVRLSAPSGQITFLAYDTQNPVWFVRGLISDKKDLISKTVLY
jgi:S1-C subfamily serine protease